MLNFKSCLVKIWPYENNVFLMNCNSLVNTDSFYTKFTNTTFPKVHIPHLTRAYYEIGVK